MPIPSPRPLRVGSSCGHSRLVPFTTCRPIVPSPGCSVRSASWTALIGRGPPAPTRTGFTPTADRNAAPRRRRTETGDHEDRLDEVGEPTGVRCPCDRTPRRSRRRRRARRSAARLSSGAAYDLSRSRRPSWVRSPISSSTLGRVRDRRPAVAASDVSAVGDLAASRSMISATRSSRSSVRAAGCGRAAAARPAADSTHRSRRRGGRCGANRSAMPIGSDDRRRRGPSAVRR